MIFKTITDETTISGQRIVSSLQARKIAQQQATEQLEIDIACLKEYQIACHNGTVTTEQFDAIMKRASVSAIEYSAKIKAGTGSAQSYANAQKATNFVLREVSIGANIASKAVKLLSATLNMLIFTAIIQGITWLIQKVDEWVVTAKEAKEAADAFKNSLSSFFNETQSNLKTISSLSDRFNELSKNVDANGKKISGTEEEYAEFLDICNQVSQIMPELIIGYTNEGDAIISLQGKVDSLTESYKEAIRAKASMFVTDGDENGNSIDSFFDDYNKFVNGDRGLLGLKISPSTTQFSSEQFEEYYGYDEIHGYLSNVVDATLEDLKKLRAGTREYVYLTGILKDAGYEISEISNDNYNAVHDVFRNRLNVIEKEMSDRVLNIRSAFQNMLYADADYWQIDDKNVLSAINSLYASIDNEFIKKNELFNKTALQSFESNFISLFNNEDIKQAMVDFYTPMSDDESINDVISRLNSSLTIIQNYCDENGITVPISISDDIDALEENYLTMLNEVATRVSGINFSDPFFEPRNVTDEQLSKYHEIYDKIDEFTKQYSINTQDEIAAFQKALEEANYDIEKAFENYLATEEAEESPKFFDQLNNSKDSLDKFQSSVKSAYDAYSTLLSGNYSSNELLDSIQAINQAMSDIGSEIQWESMLGGGIGLAQVQETLEREFQKYAESILRDAGIEISSDFGQMLAHNIVQAQKASTQLEVLNDQIDSLQAAYSDLTDIVETYNETGYITFDQLQKLLEMEPQYILCLVDENGQLQLNEQSMIALANKRLDDAAAQAVQQAITELGTLALQDEKVAIEQNTEAFSEEINVLTDYNEELANSIVETNLMASSVRDLNAAIRGAEENGTTDDQINTVLTNLDTKLQLIKNVRDQANKGLGGLGSVMKSSSSKSSSSSKKDFEETFDWIETAIDRIERSISNLDLKASSVYRSWSERNSNLKAELADVKKEMDIQASGYNKYMQQANSVGLSEEWASKVRNGQIDINSITDKGLAERIKEYQDWYRNMPLYLVTGGGILFNC